MTRGRTTARRLLTSILATEWMIRPEWLEQFAGLAGRLGKDGEATLMADEIRQEIRRVLASLTKDRGERRSVAFDYGQPLGGDGIRATVRDGVAIVPVMGPLYHYADELHDVCGCSSYAQITNDMGAVRAAHERGRVHAAVFEVDSPGGEVGGCGETADLIWRLAQVIPVAAYVSDLGASAAYYLASAAGRLFTAPAAIVGSIGVAAAFRRSGREGLIEIVSSQSPKKRPDVETEPGRAQVQATLDALADVFIADVARFRGVTPEDVLERFGQGDLLVGAGAHRAGMIDGLTTFEDVITAMADPGRARAILRPAASAGGRVTSLMEDPMADDKKPQKIDRAFLNEHHAELVAEILAEGKASAQPDVEKARAAGEASERERIIGVLSVGYDEEGSPRPAVKGFAKLVHAAVAKPGVTKAELALEVLSAKDAKDTGAAAKRLQEIEQDEKGEQKPGAEANPGVEGRDRKKVVEGAMAAARAAGVIASKPSKN